MGSRSGRLTGNRSRSGTDLCRRLAATPKPCSRSFPPSAAPSGASSSGNGATRRIDWSRDGRWLVTSPATIRAARERGITFISPTTGERIDWVALDKSYEESTDPALSPDGRQIAFLRLKDDFSADLFVAPVAADGKPGGSPRQIQYGGREARNPVWSADGRELLIIDGAPSSNGTIVRVPADGSRPGVRLAGLEHPNAFSTSADGSRLVFSRAGGNADLWRIDLRILRQAVVSRRRRCTTKVPATRRTRSASRFRRTGRAHGRSGWLMSRETTHWR